MTECHRPGCTEPVDPDRDHRGELLPPGAWRRRYCTVTCRELAEQDRRRTGRAAATAARHRADDLAARLIRARTEPPLPGMPTDPLLEETAHG